MSMVEYTTEPMIGRSLYGVEPVGEEVLTILLDESDLVEPAEEAGQVSEKQGNAARWGAEASFRPALRRAGASKELVRAIPPGLIDKKFDQLEEEQGDRIQELLQQGLNVVYRVKLIVSDGYFRVEVPKELPQYTFPEVRSVATAYADGPSGRGWQNGEGEVTIIHTMPSESLQTKLMPGQLLSSLGLRISCESLQQEVREAGVPAVLLMHVSLGLVLRDPRGRVTASIDDLLKSIGLDPRSTEARQVERCRIWRWLLLFDATWVIGQRRGTWRDPRTKKVVDTTSVDPLLKVVGTEFPERQPLDTSGPPLKVSMVAGEWLEQWRGNRQMLSEFGDVLRIAAIPAGRPSGAWAQGIGLALQQRWREWAHDAKLVRVGEEKHLTPRFRKPFTRRDLLNLFRCSPHVDEVLESNDPGRAKKYWVEAIKLLKTEGVVGCYREVAPLTVGRQGWRNAWLDQPLDIRPAAEGDVLDIAELVRATANARKKLKQNS